MSGAHAAVRAVGKGLGSLTLLDGHLCSSCRRHIFQRRTASTAAASEVRTEDIDPSSLPTKASNSSAPPKPKLAYQVRAGVVLSRPPQITKDLHPFEKAYYFYQRRLNERLALPAMQYFYFKPNTPAMIDWKRKRKMRRDTAARDIGLYNAYKDDSWHDELLIGKDEQLTEPEYQARVLIQDSIPLPKDGEEEEEEEERARAKEPEIELQPRRTHADEKNDQRSLARALQRTLYLVVQNEKGNWTFPEDVILGRESLALAAERIITQAGGPNMNTWVVGNHPAGHRVLKYPQPKEKDIGHLDLGYKLFFMRARIMAGQANLAENLLGLKDFKWLAREEVEKQVDRGYWNSIRCMLPDR